MIPVRFAHHARCRPEERELNVNKFVARLVIGGMATLNELQTIYDLEDMYYLNEILNLREEHDFLEAEKIRRG